MPPVYVLDDEPGINAFAAGHQPATPWWPSPAAASSYLNRDELQGVIGHEFSHILNGDMRLNLRLIGIAQRHPRPGDPRLLPHAHRRQFSPADSDKKGGGAAGSSSLGLGMLIIGYIGVFFGKLIKAAVSRQREFLADASRCSSPAIPAASPAR